MSLFGRDQDESKGLDEAPEPVEQEEDSFTWPSREDEEPELQTEGNEDSAVLPDEGETVTAPAFTGQDVGTPQAEEESVGLYGKFHVERVDGKDRPGGPKEDAKYFVLDYVNDPVARIALRAYVTELRRRGIESELAEDLNREINALRGR